MAEEKFVDNYGNKILEGLYTDSEGEFYRLNYDPRLRNWHFMNSRFGFSAGIGFESGVLTLSKARQLTKIDDAKGAAQELRRQARWLEEEAKDLRKRKTLETTASI